MTQQNSKLNKPNNNNDNLNLIKPKQYECFYCMDLIHEII